MAQVSGCRPPDRLAERDDTGPRRRCRPPGCLKKDVAADAGDISQLSARGQSRDGRLALIGGKRSRPKLWTWRL